MKARKSLDANSISESESLRSHALPPGQFLIHPSGLRDVAAVEHHQVGDWSIAANAPCVELQASDRCIGWLIGQCIDETGLQTNNVLFNWDRRDWRVLEDALYKLAGRWVAVVQGDVETRLYLDAGGTLAAVYSKSRRIIGSTADFITNRKPDRSPQAFYPAGMTPWHDIDRLLPNHYLQLDSWTTERHWPTPIDPSSLVLTGTNYIDELVSTIANRLKHIMLSVAAVSPSYLGITAGRDSRMMMAALSGHWSNFCFVTYVYANRNGRIDSHLSRVMNRRFGLGTSFVPVREVDSSLDEEYLRLTGRCGGSKARFRNACLQHQEMKSAFLWGIAGGVGRAYYWRKDDASLERLSSTSCLKRLGLPEEPAAVKSLDLWLRNASRIPVETQLDLLYIEHRLGGWAGPHAYGYPFDVIICPFCDRQIFDAMLRLPSEWRSQHRLVSEIINRYSPDLATIPYQQFTGLRLLWTRLVRRALPLVRPSNRVRLQNMLKA